MSDPDTVQQFISSIKGNPKTVGNIYLTLQMKSKSARAWQYVVHDALDGVVSPKRRKPRRFLFTQDDVTRILGNADEPYRTFYWLAAERGLRAGEICGLRLEDIDFEVGPIHVRQSAWRASGRAAESETIRIASAPAMATIIFITRRIFPPRKLWINPTKHIAERCRDAINRRVLMPASKSSHRLALS
jgi:integrase